MVKEGTELKGERRGPTADREAEVLAGESERIGQLLKRMLSRLEGKEGVKEVRGDHEGRSRQWLFRPLGFEHGVARVWVTVYDYRGQGGSEPLKRAFRVRVVPPEGKPQREWLINEVETPGRVEFTPYFFEFELDREAMQHAGEPVSRDLALLDDPSVKDMDDTYRTLEDCWEAFQAGVSETIVG